MIDGWDDDKSLGKEYWNIDGASLSWRDGWNDWPKAFADGSCDGFEDGFDDGCLRMFSDGAMDTSCNSLNDGFNDRKFDLFDEGIDNLLISEGTNEANGISKLLIKDGTIDSFIEIMTTVDCLDGRSEADSLCD